MKKFEKDAFGEKPVRRSKSEEENAPTYRPRSYRPRITEEETPASEPTERKVREERPKPQAISSENTDSERPRVERKSYFTKRHESQSANNEEERTPYERKPRSFDKDRNPFSSDDSSNEGERRSFNRDRKPFDGERRERRSFDGERKPFNREGGERRSFDRDRKPFDGERRERKPFDGERKPFDREGGERRSFDRDRKPFDGERRERRSFDGERKPFNREGGERRSFDRDRKPFDGERRERRSFDGERKPFNREGGERRVFERERSGGYGRDNKFNREWFRDDNAASEKNWNGSTKPQGADNELKLDQDGLIRLNKFIANSGLCSRREADEHIANGLITVNGEVVAQLGAKVKPTDEITFRGKKLETERKIYILLNKPKDYVTTVDDPHAKHTVMELVEGACEERVYPVGRLDRQSTGLLLLTNDGELTTRLTHPSHNKKKVYHVELDKKLAQTDMDKVLEGVDLEGEVVKADAIAYIDNRDLTQIGIEIHTGQNRVIRRIFEALGYRVEKLDRVYYAGLTKKNLPRGKFRFLSQYEISMLKMNRFE
ncbi:RNA pseudouridylate synthase [anaerobic digester metagenome]